MAPTVAPSLHHIAMQNQPEISLSGDLYAVAILSHTADPSDCKTEDFLWFKVKAKHSVSRLKSAYLKMTKTNVVLNHNGQPVGDATQMRDLGPENHQKTIILTAHEAGLSSSSPSTTSRNREPLQPINIQPTISNAANDSGRKPLIKAEAPYAAPSLQQYPSRETLSSPKLPGPSVRPSLPVIKGENTPAASPVNQSRAPFQNGSPSKFTPHPTITSAASASVKTEPRGDTPMSGTETQDRFPKQNPQITRLQNLIEEAMPDVLEAEVRASKAFLETLRTPLEEKISHQDVTHWVKQISNLENRKVDTPTIIGVVGNTGAGKSSVINALLDEERLVPTNCMRACTAVVTEISYNASDDPATKYRAEIEFIQPADWEKDLRVSLEELKDGNGCISKEVYNADSEAGIAYAKIRAVYPQKTKDELAASSIETLMRDPAVKNVLGTTKKVEKAESSSLYRTLQLYVDSKEKSTETKKKKDKSEKQMEFWPLTKVVRIYTKANALSTGAVIVDLPGVHDSNAARAAVAAGYLKQCTGLWIVAPIGRAVDDKSAKTLLGESFKRQLKYDGIYSRVTFICSKTDDISITEAADSLGLEDEMAADWEKMDALDEEIAALKQKKKDLEESKAVYLEVMNDADDAIEIWDKLKDDCEDGKTVWAPKDAPKKRKRSDEPKKSRKKSKKSKDTASEDGNDFIDDESDDDEIDDASGSEGSDDEDSTSEKGGPLTLDAIDEKLDQLKEDKKKARRERSDIDGKIKDAKKEIAGLEQMKFEIETAMSAICIKSRNDYSKGAIQADFAAGIKELDQENAQEEDEENFNPDEDIRDYEEVAKSLKVFCVSSRAYQKLEGRLARDSNVPGFLSEEATEVPALQAHCKKLTEAGRASNCRTWLTDLSQLLNSLSMWAASGDGTMKMTDSQMRSEALFLKSRLANLEKALEKLVEDILKEMQQTLSENIFENFDHAIQQAVDEATTTATRWGDRKSGGFYWATYKALCRRNGVFSGTAGPKDMNAELIAPLIKLLASNWEKAFARRLPSVLQSFSRKSKTLLLSFHAEIESRCRKNGVGVAGLNMLSQQLRNYEGTFVNLTNEMIEVINNLQREANREFTPVIADNLSSAYEFCTAEVGSGQYLRMKTHMTSHVDSNRTAMFTKSTEEVKARLVLMCRAVEERMANKAEEVWEAMNRDYTQVISGRQLPAGQQEPKWERQLKAEIAKTIEDRSKAIEEAEKTAEVSADTAEPNATKG